jgi:hypothetical protein
MRASGAGVETRTLLLRVVLLLVRVVGAVRGPRVGRGLVLVLVVAALGRLLVFRLLLLLFARLRGGVGGGG